MDENVIKLVSEDLSTVKNLILSSLNSEIVSFDKAMNFYLKAPSKLLRPIMCNKKKKALYGEVNDKILYISSAIELAHNASLLHDDVIDDALMRRNINSFNEKFGSKSAILAGDWLVSQVMFFLNKVGNNKLYELFAEAIKKMAEKTNAVRAVSLKIRFVTEDTTKLCFFAAASDISGIKRADTECKSVDGKNKTGKAIPFIIPNCESAEADENG